MVCIDMVCIMAFIGMYYFWYVSHVLESVVMYSRVICGIIMCKYSYVLVSIDMYGKMVCMVHIGMYLYVLVSINLY